MTAEADSLENLYIQPTLGHGLRIWWAFYWRNTIVTLTILFVLGIALELVSAPPKDRTYALQYGQYVVSYIVAIFIIHYVVRKNFRGYCIKLISTGDETPQVLKPTRKRTFRIWWTYTWRTVIYVAILSIAINVPLGFLNGAVQVMFPAIVKAFSSVVSLGIAAAVGLFVIYSNILDEEIGDFTVTLAPNEPSHHAIAGVTSPTTDTSA